MAFERIGLGGILRFNEKQALAGMRRAQAGFARLHGGVRKLGAGLSMMGDGMRNAGMAMLPVTAGLGFGAVKAAKFEKQMSAVGAITRSSADDLAALTNEAKRQGVVSVFSAQQSAEAMEFMGRAGFDTNQIIEGLGGVMAAAAADGISLATSSDIVARVVKGMGLEIKEASHVADVLALTSAKTNTNITALGEAFTYGAPQAAALGISLEETTAAFGLMADAGLRGSIGGTSFMNMLVKLSKPSAKAKDLIKKFGISLTDSQGRMKPLPDIIGAFKKELDKVPDVAERAAMGAELFGLRGVKAFSALSIAGRQRMAELTEDLEASSFGLGAAQEMANKRLDNFLGALTLFGSSLEAVAIEFFGPFLGAFKETTQDMTAALNSVLFAVQGLKQIREQASLSAVKAAKRESKALVEETKILTNLGRREQSTAKAGIAAIQARIIGEEKLTREQTRARSRSFAEFVKGNLAREKLTKEQRSRELKAIDQFIEDNEKGELSTQERVAMEKQYLRTLTTIGAKGKKIGQAEAQRRADNLEAMIKERAEAAKLEAAAETAILREEKFAEIEKEHGRTARLIAEGVLQAIEQIKAGFTAAISAVRNFSNRFGEALGEGRLKSFARLATIGVVVAGALAPVFLGIAAIGFVIKSVMIPQIVGLFKVVAGLKSVIVGLVNVVGGSLMAAFWPLVAVAAVAAGAFLYLRKEGESITDTFYRLWGGLQGLVVGLFGFRKEGESTTEALRRGFDLVVQGAERLWAEGIKPFLIDSWELVKAAVGAVAGFIRGVWAQVQLAMAEFGLVEKVRARLWGVWEVVKSVADAIGGAFMTVVDVVRTVVWPFISGFVSGFASALAPLLQTWWSVWSSVVEIFDSVWATIKTVVQTFGELWTEIVDLFVDDIDRSSTKWSSLGETIGQVAAWLLDTFISLVGVVVDVVKTIFQGVLWLVRGLVKLFGFLAKVAIPTLLLPFKALWQGVKTFASGVLDLFRGDFKQGLKKIFLSLVDILLLPFRMIMKAIVQLAKAAPGIMGKLVSKDTVAKLDKFAKYGFTGPAKHPKKNVVTKTAEQRQADLGLDLPAQQRRRVVMPAFQIKGLDKPIAEIGPKVAEIMQKGDIKSKARAARIAAMLTQTGKEVNAENILAAKQALGTVSKRRRIEAKQREKAAEKELQANVKVEDKRKLDITNKMCVDGEAASVATSKHQRNVFERNGATHEPYLQKLSTETGVRMAGNSRG